MRETDMRRFVILFLLVALGLAACSGSDDAETTSRALDGAAAPEEAADAGAAEPPAGEQAGDNPSGGGGGDLLTVRGAAGREIVRRASIELAVDDPEETVREVTAAVTRAGGFVSSADLHRSEDGVLRGTMQLRVPVGDLDSTLTNLEDLAEEVRSKTLSSEDVTGEVVDIEADLRNLRALETELRTLLAEVREQSGNVDQVFAVFERIRNVRSEIERLEGRRETLADLVSLATVTVQIVPTEAALPPGTDVGDWQPAVVVRDALAATAGALQTAANVAIWVALTVVPVLALLALPLAAGWWLLRRRDRVAGATSE